MGHPDKSLIQALLDGEVEGTEADTLRAHLESCRECEAGAEALEVASLETTRALLLVDTEPRLQDARSQVLGKKSLRSKRVFGFSMSLPKAASIALLLTGAAATALPGSPVRRWLVQGWAALTETVPSGSDQEDPSGSGEDQTALSPEGLISEIGAGIPALTGGVEIWIHDLAAEAELRVVWIDGDEAWIRAGEGTRFTREGSRLDAFAPPGAVRVEIPRDLEQVVVGLNGTVLLRKSGGEVEIAGPVQLRTPSEIIFEAPGSTNDGPS